jgi:hypothetical protein
MQNICNAVYLTNMVYFRYIIVSILHKGDKTDNHINIKLVGNTAKSEASKLIQRTKVFVACHTVRKFLGLV